MRAPLLGQAAVFAALLALSTCLTGSHLCPRSLDCARAGRHFCQPGSSHCGPCLRPLLENSRGRCVVKRRPVPRPAQPITDKESTYPMLDEEIDVLSAIISEQRTVPKLPAPISQHFSAPKTNQLAVPEPSRDGAATTAGPSASLPSVQASPNTTTLPATPVTTTTNHSHLFSDPIILPYPSNDPVFIIMSSVFVVAGSLALFIAGACWVRLQKGVRLTQKVDYPVFGLMRPQTFDDLPGDKKLAHSAQMYHYQHQKQQMLSLEKHRDEPKAPDSGASTDEENEDGDFTVYECPGLAPTGEMEVKNPLFDDSTLYLQRFHK